MIITKLALLMVIIGSIVGCGKPVPVDPNATDESPGIQKTQVGATFNMSSASAAATVSPGEMSIYLKDPTTITGSFMCYIGGAAQGSVSYSVKVKWDTSSTLYVNSAPSTSKTGCVSNRYFGFKQGYMKYSFSSDKTVLTITDLLTNTTAVFTQQLTN